MHYHIVHTTTYHYNQQVFLKPHLLRICPRSDRYQNLKNYGLLIEPKPQDISQFIDLDGNNLIKVWFNQATQRLKIHVNIEIETLHSNPFNYLLEPWATKLPFDYPNLLLVQLQPYLKSYGTTIDPMALELAQEIEHEVNGNVLSFLAVLNQKIYEECQYLIRETGTAFSPGMTWKLKEGSCRDFTLLFMEVCRSVGLGARFVSGYQEGDEDQQERDLHAWAEVYLPGAGWRGYDPTYGLAVSDRHIALAASAMPNYTTPILGDIIPVQSIFAGAPPLKSEMEAQIKIFIDE